MSRGTDGERWSAVEQSGASNAGAGHVGRVALIARLDQEAAEADEMLTRAIEAARLDLIAGCDPLKVTAAIASASADNGEAYTSVMFARAVLRLARQGATRSEAS
jgi:hypothetical protein